MDHQIKESSQQSSHLQEKQKQLDQSLEEKLAKKQALMNETLVYQKQQRRYQDLRDKKYKFVCENGNLRKEETDKAREKFGKISTLLQNIKAQVPPRIKFLADRLEIFLESTSTTIKQV